ncbi:HpsJ family protein [Synechococcus sp. EJ6-Ellesmere]|uniref:HpsJ family protein n=1 Tax=Synechococcus sp. EJ6-Ellesmere TaxID=2823734 RepID=UPI0020CD8783|nr:HpsJ family protein [Synechococcus sp. EJ6-Ellesmere]MCP9825077.1 HpsJ family protein [Synechococcus sp. EJ6-Ellesmere]
MTTASTSRLGYLLRWLGLTLVVLLGLQLAAVVSAWSWQEEAFRQMVIERLITQSPMALVGLLLALFGSRLDQTDPRSPLRWLVAALAALLAIGLAVSVPVAISGDGVLTAKTEQTLTAQRSQLEMAKQQSQNPQVLEQLVRQAEQSGQVPPQATEEQKQQAARGFIDRQLQQMEQQFKEAERAQGLAVNQRRYAGTGSAAVLAVAFTLLALAALL